MPYLSLGGALHFVTFINDATRKAWVYPVWTKNRVFTIFKDWLTMVKNQMDRKLKCSRSDNEGEYKFDKFATFYRQHNIMRELTAPHNVEQDGIVE